MNNTYIIKKESIVKALDDIAEFEDKMKLFLSKHKDFKYSISIDTDDEGCVVKINIKNSNEQEDPEVFKEIAKTR